MSDTTQIQDDEIDLGELFASLWAYKGWTAIITAISVFLGGLYALNAEKVYTGAALFQLEDTEKSGLSLPGEAAGLAALAGLGGVVSEGNILFDRITGRAFILELDETVDLKGDPYFNDFNPNAEDPPWKAAIKRAIGYQSEERGPDEIIENNIVTAFRENVRVEETDNGALSINVDHVEPTRAAEIANAIMDKIVEQVERENEARQRRELTYLSETLADTLREMEDAQARLKNFAIENSTLSIEALAAGSVALDEVRNRLERATLLRDAAYALLESIDNGQTDDDAYARLRQSHPIIDDVEFRRVLGLTEVISEFAWPDRDLLAAVAATLDDRRERILREKERLEEEAISYANAAEQLAALEREAKIAEASYTVLIEQVKAQSLLAGYRGETAKVFERAVPPLAPSKPNRKLVLALALVLGLFVGAGNALALSLRRGVYFSRRAMIDELAPEAVLPAANLRKLNRKSLADVVAQVSRLKTKSLSEVAVFLRGRHSNAALIISGGARCQARTAALATAATAAKSGRNVAVIDLSRTGVAPKDDEPGGLWQIIQSEGRVTEFAFAGGEQNLGLLASNKFDDAVAELSDKADLLIFSSERDSAEMSAVGLSGLSPSIVLLGRPKRTPKSLIQKLRSLKLPIILLLE